MIRNQLHLHGIITLFVMWSAPIEHCSADLLRPNPDLNTSRQTSETLLRAKIQKKTEEFLCTDESPSYPIDQCIANISKAKQDLGTNELDREGFMNFVALQTRGLISPEKFSQLPINLVMLFNQMACECSTQNNASKDCCVGDNAHIPLTFESGVIFDADRICSRLERAVGQSCQILRRKNEL